MIHELTAIIFYVPRMMQALSSTVFNVNRKRACKYCKNYAITIYGGSSVILGWVTGLVTPFFRVDERR